MSNICSCMTKHTIEFSIAPVFNKLFRKGQESSNLSRVYLTTYLWYVLPLGKFISGQAHANANVTLCSFSAGIVKEAAMAAPMTDPGSEGADISSDLRRSKDPYY